MEKVKKGLRGKQVFPLAGAEDHIYMYCHSRSIREKPLFERDGIIKDSSSSSSSP